MSKGKIYIYTGIIFLFLTLFGKLELRAQYPTSSVGFVGGYAEDGYGMTLNFNYYVSRTDYVQGAVYASFSKENQRQFEIPFDIFTTNFGYYKRVYGSLRETYIINLGVGAVMGYEVVNNGVSLLNNGAIIDSKTNFIYGAFGSVELEIPVTNKWSFLAKYNQFYHKNSDLGELTLFVGGGIRFFLFY